MPARDRNRNFETLFRSCFQDLARFTYSYVNDEETAKDIVHDAFLALWHNHERLDDSYSLRPWLFTLCRNGALDYLKHQRVVNLNEQELSRYLQEAPEDTEPFETRLKRVQEKLKHLPERQREVVMKCLAEGKKYKEVAEELGISLNSVKTHLARGLNFLREELREEVILYLILSKE